MALFRILDQAPVYLDRNGKPLAGGQLAFYETGTTTPKDVFSDPDKSSNLGATVALDADGRTASDVWGDGEYRVRLYAADDTLITESENVQGSAGGPSTIPALVSGYFLTNDGSQLQWVQLRQLPDPTGNANKVLGTDGANFIFFDRPSDGDAGSDADVFVSDSQAVIGDGSATQDKFMVQVGTGTAPPTGNQSTSKAVSFPTAFKSVMAVAINITNTGYSAVGFYAVAQAISQTTTGFTASFNVPAHGGGSDHDADLTADIAFQWIAFGTVAP